MSDAQDMRSCNGQQSERRGILVSGAPIIVAALVVVNFFNRFFASGFQEITGTRGDARFILSVFEHWRNVLQGRSDWQSPNFFFPIEGTLAYSDALLAGGLIHTVFRTLGFDPFLSYQFTLIVFLITGYAGILWVCRRFLGMPVIVAALTAGLAVSINGLKFQALHGQLMTFVWVPLFFGLIGAWLQTQDRGRLIWLASALAMFVLLLFTSFYAIWFSALLVLLTLPCACGLLLVQKRFSFSPVIGFFRMRWLDFAISLVVVAVAGLVFIDLYGEAREVASQTGGFGWQRVISSLPKFQDILYIERFNWLYNHVLTFYDTDPSDYHKLNDLSSGFTPVLLLSSLVLGVFAVREGLKDKQFGPLSITAVAFVVIALGALMIYKVAGVSLWSVAYVLVPGADAIRGPSRINLVLGQFMVIAAAYTAFQLSRKATAVQRFCLALLFALIAVEQVNTRHFTYDRTHEKEMIAEARPPEQCAQFFLTDADKRSRQERVLFIDANLIASVHDLPTPQGYSGVYPPEFHTYTRHAFANGYPLNVAGWIEHFATQDTIPVCIFDLTHRNWSIFESVAELKSAYLKKRKTGSIIDFADSDATDGLLVGNWSGTDKWGRWTRDQDAGVILSFADSKPRRLVFSLGALVGPQMPDMHVRVKINGRDATRWGFRYPEARGARPTQAVDRMVTLMSEDYDAGNSVTVVFHIERPRSPSDTDSRRDDKRQLGLSVYKLKIESEN